MYLGDVAVTLARVLGCAREREGAGADGAPGELGELGEKVKRAAAALGASLSRYFEDEALRGKAEECRALLGAASIAI